MREIAPLPSSFTLLSILGFLISILLIFPRWPTWGFAFTLTFIIMFVASMISMTYADAEAELYMDEHKRKR